MDDVAILLVILLGSLVSAVLLVLLVLAILKCRDESKHTDDTTSIAHTKLEERIDERLEAGSTAAITIIPITGDNTSDGQTSPRRPKWYPYYLQAKLGHTGTETRH